MNRMNVTAYFEIYVVCEDFGSNWRSGVRTWFGLGSLPPWGEKQISTLHNEFESNALLILKMRVVID